MIAKLEGLVQEVVGWGAGNWGEPGGGLGSDPCRGGIVLTQSYSRLREGSDPMFPVSTVRLRISRKQL